MGLYRACLRAGGHPGVRRVNTVELKQWANADKPPSLAICEIPSTPSTCKRPHRYGSAKARESGARAQKAVHLRYNLMLG